MMLSPNHMKASHSSTKSEHDFYGSIDPVCKQSIKLDKNTLSYQYLSTTYYFDTEECLNQFKQAPDNYLIKKEHNHHRVGNHMGLLWGIGAAVMVGMMVLMVF